MSDARQNRYVDNARDRRVSFLITLASLVIVVLILGLTPGAVPRDWPAARLQVDLAPLMAQNWLVQFHIATVVAALALGPVQFALPKGTGFHRTLGWAWAGAMFSTAVATFFIRDMRDGQLSPIHIFSLMTFIGVPMALWLARVKVASHARTMVSLYVGLVIAGVTAIAPGRLIWEMFFG
ncbi:MAG: DUF2306 domain-containing protein [Hyphomonadaceae bacterium]